MPDDETTTTPKTEATIYRTKFHQVYDIPKHDELVQGEVTRDHIRLNPGAKELARGMLLMLNGDSFEPATATGAASSSELCICASDYTSESVETEEGSIYLVWAYFSGTFKGSSIILPYETEEDDHDELIEVLRPALRKQNIFVQ